MQILPWKKIDEKIERANSWWEYRLAKFEIPGGKQIDYHYIHSHDVAVSIVINDKGTISFVRQYRALYDMFTIEFPMGGVEKGENSLAAAHREFAEESGSGVVNLELVGKIQPSNAMLDNWVYIYVGAGLTSTDAKPDEGEAFEQIYLSPEEIDAKIASGGIVDGITVASWMIAKTRVSDLVEWNTRN